MSEKIEWIEIGSPSYVEGKFGQAVSLDANNKIQTKNPVTFGGADFTIDFWANVTSLPFNTAGNIFYATSKSSEYLRISKASKSTSFYFEAYDGIALLSNNASLTFPSNTWKHFEFCYKHETGNGYIFLDGKRITITTLTQNRRIERLARTITLGGLPCLFEEFRILDGVCLHTEDFDVPTAPYESSDENMEKGILKFIDASGAVREINNENPADLVTYDDNGTDTTVAQILGQLQTTLAAINGRLQQLESDATVTSTKIQQIESDTATMAATLDDHEERIFRLEGQVFAEVLGTVQTATGAGYGQFFTVDKQGQPLNGDAEEVDSGTTLGITQTATGAGYGQFFTVENGNRINGDAEEVDSGTTLGITQTATGGGYGGWTVEE